MGDQMHTAAVLDVLAERQRQIVVEGWTSEHDDQHDDGQLALAACCYALPEYHQSIRTAAHPMMPQPTLVERLWPWNADWWKPSDVRRDLVKAAALIVAEIERLDRAALAGATSPNHDPDTAPSQGADPAGGDQSPSQPKGPIR